MGMPGQASRVACSSPSEPRDRDVKIAASVREALVLFGAVGYCSFDNTPGGSLVTIGLFHSNIVSLFLVRLRGQRTGGRWSLYSSPRSSTVQLHRCRDATVTNPTTMTWSWGISETQ
ncbi:hypothetical protein K456DRAFT_1679609 [Colletotrichum gloeosporioides 23]|nr:hypothetical protein K456DRAFT_1679609 [Colletotrichum gloeosporioides 23]